MGIFQVTGYPKTRHSAAGATHKYPIEGKDDGPQPADYVFTSAPQDVVPHPSSIKGHVAASCSTCPPFLHNPCRDKAVYTIQPTPILHCFVGLCWPGSGL